MDFTKNSKTNYFCAREGKTVFLLGTKTLIYEIDDNPEVSHNLRMLIDLIDEPSSYDEFTAALSKIKNPSQYFLWEWESRWHK